MSRLPFGLGASLVLALAATLSPTARAGVVYYDSRSDFLAAGAIQSTANLDAYSADTIVGNGTQIGDVIFQIASYGVVLGPAGSFYKPVEKIAVQPNFSVVDIAVAAGTNYNMLGFKQGTMLGATAVQISVTTNLGSYNFNVGGSYAGTALLFEGFVATSPGEYFTGFTAYAAPSLGGGVGVTDFELGSTAVVPEPATFAGAALSLVLGLAARRLRRRRSA